MNFIAPTAKIGKNCVIQHGAIIEDRAVIGDNCFIGYYSVIRPKVIIGNNTEIRCHCFIAESAKIGSKVRVFQFSNIGKLSVIEDCVYIGARVLMTNDRKLTYLRSEDHFEAPHVEYGARIASGVILLPGVRIGKNAVVGGGSVVTKNVPDEQCWYGVPAVFKKMVPREEQL